MGGKAKSKGQVAQEASTERDELYKLALSEYENEQQKPPGTARDGLRAVCRRVEKLHHERTGCFVQLDHTTLARHYKGGRTIHDFNATKELVTPEEAEVLIAYIIECANRGFPLSYRRLAEHANEILRARLGAEYPGVGVNWPERFIARHRNRVKMHWSRTLESKRGQAVNPATDAAWWSLLKHTIEANDIQPKDMYASDESGFSTGFGTRERVAGPAGNKVQHQQRGGSRENITVLVTISADGRSLPPVVIFKGQHYQVAWKQDNPLNASLGYSKKGWMTGEISIESIKHFDAQTRGIANGRRRLHLVDGHITHYTRDVLEYARSVGIDILCYPAHTTHVYQGLDVSLFGPLKEAFSQERDRWEREQHEQVSKSNFLAVYGAAHIRIMTPTNIRAAWAKCGAFPLNPQVVTTQMLAPSRETSWEAHMPLPQPTPIRVMARLLRVQEHDQPHALATSSSAPTDRTESSAAERAAANDADNAAADAVRSDHIPIDPVLLTPRAPAPVRRTEPTPRTALMSTGAAFLVQPEPLTVEMAVPRAQITIPPRWTIAHDLLVQQPETQREAELQAMLHATLKVNDAQYSSLLNTHATMVLQNSYCERVKGQLAAEQQKKQRTKATRVMGDGMPHLLTGDEFRERLDKHDALVAQAEQEKRDRDAARDRYQLEMEQWRQEEAERKRANAEHTEAWKNEVSAWEAERDRAKAEKRRPRWTKPVRGPQLKAKPKPKARAQPIVEDDDMEDLRALLGAEDSSDDDDEGSA